MIHCKYLIFESDKRFKVDKFRFDVGYGKLSRDLGWLGADVDTWVYLMEPPRPQKICPISS